MLPLKSSKISCLHYQQIENSNANNITQIKRRLYKYTNLNKASTFSNFCSVFILLFTFFMHITLINSTIYFHLAAKVFDSPLSRGYIVRNLKLSWKLLTDSSAITSTKLLSLNYFKFILNKNNLGKNWYLLAWCFKIFYFETPNPHAFKLLLKILLAEIFEAVN